MPILDDQQKHADTSSDRLCPRASTPTKKGRVRTWPVSSLLGSPPRGREHRALLMLVWLEPKVRPGHRLVTSGRGEEAACVHLALPHGTCISSVHRGRPVAGSLSPHWGANHPLSPITETVGTPSCQAVHRRGTPSHTRGRMGGERPDHRKGRGLGQPGWETQGLTSSNQFLVKTSINGN